MRGVAIAATGMYLPARVVTNEDLIAEGGLPVSARWIERHTGIRERRWAAEGEFTSDLAAAAARDVLARAGVDAADLDRLILATISPDWPTPATAVVVQHAIGARCPAFDVSSACAGFMVALDLGVRCVQTGENAVLALAAEIRSRWIDKTDPRVAPLFSDGAAGALLVPAPAGTGFLATVLQADGSGAEKVLVPAGGSRKPASAETVAAGEHFIRMVDGRAIFEQAVVGMGAIAALALEKAGLSLGDVDLVIPHQPNKLIVEAAKKAMGVPLDRVVMTVDRLGNCTAATVPLALHEAVVSGRLRPGQTALLLAVGGGYSAGAAVYKVPG
ncbi:MAG: 3-oxoacyl-(acyl-carrier-protein) synthase [Cyanobacteria bacterium RYN_339]|nr:3-oxoacyl-(acyl-carrier-protein) synthase [Cyanobacteria bacterium RYN_339]